MSAANDVYRLIDSVRKSVNRELLIQKYTRMPSQLMLENVVRKKKMCVYLEWWSNDHPPKIYRIYTSTSWLPPGNKSSKYCILHEDGRWYKFYP